MEAKKGGNWIAYESDEAARKGEVALLKANIGLYEDEGFPADGSSLYWNASQPPKYSIPSEMVQWCRISGKEIAGCEAPETWIDGAVRIGALADSWFLGALAIVGGCIESKGKDGSNSMQVIVSDRYAARGIYTAKFFKDGAWVYVHIDDRIPCTRDGYPLFGRSANPNEVWVMILEKAYAKLHASYEAIRCGSVEEALRDITSFPGRVLRLEEDQPSLRSLEVEVFASIATEEEKSFLALAGIDWKELKRIKSRGNNTISPIGVMAMQDQVNSNNGILHKTPYAIVDMLVVTAEATIAYDALELRMVKLWNPWGSVGHFTGNWSPGHSLWTQYPPIALACQTSSTFEFWIEWKDLLQHFDTCVIARRFHSESSSGEPSCPRQRGTLRPNSIPPQFCVDVPVSTDVCFELSQPDSRFFGDKYAAPISLRVQRAPPGRRIVSYKNEDTIFISPYSTARSITSFLHLEPGSYCLLPTLLGHQPRPFLLELYADKHISLNEHVLEQESEKKENDAAQQLIPNSDEESDLLRNVQPRLFLERKPGHEIHLLWQQADSLSSKLNALASTNASIDERLAEAEATLLALTSTADDRNCKVKSSIDVETSETTVNYTSSSSRSPSKSLPLSKSSSSRIRKTTNVSSAN